MQRTLINDISKSVGKEILIKGRVLTLRKMGGISFSLIQDYSGETQVVWEKENDLKVGDAVEIIGVPKVEARAKNGFELTGKELTIVAGSIEEYPFDLSKPNLSVQLNTLLDWRTLSLRHPKIQAIFKLYGLVLSSYGDVLRQNGFTQIVTPKLLEAATEGGANFFKVHYFDKYAYLAQSPQPYKQIMVGVFERVFEIGTAFRAEPHFTTRHVNEYTSLDAEMGFIESYRDVTAMLNKVIKYIFETLGESGAEYLKLHGATISKVPDEIPHLKLAEAREIVKKKYKYEIPEDTDIDPEGERLVGRYVKEELDSDFVFLTHYPWGHRPFYTMQSRENAEETYGFDLIFKGTELVTGSQRIHLYDELIANMKKKGVKPDGLEFYLDVFKFAMPPHGGWAIGSERLIQHVLGLANIKEATFFPRDVRRLNP